MLDELEDYDWQQAFGYAGEANDNGITVSIDPAVPTSAIDVSPFTREDVVEISYLDEGERDERPWLVVGKLKDGRWFFIEAGCDYTGWDCQTSGRTLVAESKKLILRFGLSKYHRERLGIPDLATRDVNMWGTDADSGAT